MTLVLWTEQARDDLSAIRAFIDHDSSYYTDVIVSRIIAAVDRLREFPQSGRVVPEWNQPDIREVVHRPYRIVYRVVNCEWISVFAQGVPAFIGTPTPGYGYESGDPFKAFLPPPLRIGDDVSEDDFRAVVFVGSESMKGTARSGQEYEAPLLMLTGAEYAVMPFQVRYERLCTALRGTRPRVVSTIVV